MKTFMHQFFRYVGQDVHFRNANLMMLIVLMIGVILGMVITRVVQIMAEKPKRNSGSIEDLSDMYYDGSFKRMRKVK